jgi:hypothetical protein
MRLIKVKLGLLWELNNGLVRIVIGIRERVGQVK